MAREVWIAGFPSPYGGADTELDHQIRLLRLCGVGVHLVPMFDACACCLSRVVERGCEVHAYRPDVFADRIVLSWCNGNFLDRLPEIIAAGRPRRVVWFNCMTRPFAQELRAHASGWIDVFGFVSAYQRSVLQPALEAVAPVRSFAYRPYFEPSSVEFVYRPWAGTYRLGRISRDDAAKFAADTWQIFEDVAVPAALTKHVRVLGYGPNARARIGDPPASLDVHTYGPGEIAATAFYRQIDTLVHKTGGSRESYCRVLVEAYAHGVVPVVENAYAFPELVVHGETGFLAESSAHMSELASELAHDPKRHCRIAHAGREYLEATLCDVESAWRGWEQVLSTPPAGVGAAAIHVRPELPAITCQCITYGRTDLLEEAIQFFLDQDYRGLKELVIVNDLANQTLVFDHPEVRILNLDARCATIGDKRNLAVRAGTGEIVVSWDDDDGYLPGHLRACAEYVRGVEHARPDRCFSWEGDRIRRIRHSAVSQHVFTRAAFDALGGYASMNSGQDTEFDERLRGRSTRVCSIRPDEITFLYRWANGDYHLSGYGRDQPGRRSGYDVIGARVRRRLESGGIPTGRVELRPRLRRDYTAMVRSFLSASPVTAVEHRI